MNAGFVALWIAVIAFVLMATGWQEQLAPDVKTRKLASLSAVVILMLPAPLWLTLNVHDAQIVIHGAVLVLLLAGAVSVLSQISVSQALYVVSCVLLLSFLWGMIRKIYSMDPVFFMLDPVWDGPLACGLLAGLLVMNTKEQFAIVVWCSVLAEVMNASLQSSGYSGMIGSAWWWDGFIIALAAARVVGLLIKGVKIISARLGLLQ